MPPRMDYRDRDAGPSPKVHLRDHESWHEAFGPVLWYLAPIASPPWCGTPLDCDWPFEESNEPMLFWCPLPDIELPDTPLGFLASVMELEASAEGES